VKIARSFLGAILTSSLLLSPFPAAASVGQWQQPVEVTIPSVEASDTNPQVVVDTTGLVTAVWAHVDSNGSVIQSSTSRNGGAWSNPVNLSEVGLSAAGAQLVVDSTGLVTAIWQIYWGTKTVIQSSTRQRGGAWSDPEDLSFTWTNSNAPQLTVDSSGLVTAVWSSGDWPTCLIESRASQSGGAWSDIVGLSIPEQGACDNSPQISVDPNGFVTAIWVSSNGSGSNIKSSSKYGVNLEGLRVWSFPESVSLSAPGVYESSPQVVADSSGRATAIWSRWVYGDNESTTIETSTSSFGTNWSPQSTISLNREIVGGPKATVDSSGVVTATWVGKSESVIQSRTSQSGGTWSDLTEVFSGHRTSDLDTSVDSTGMVTAIWTKHSNENSSILVSQFRRASDWSIPVVLMETEPGSFLGFVNLTENTSQFPIAIFGKSFAESQYLLQSISFVGNPSNTATPAAITPKLAATGANVEWLLVAGLIAVIAGAGFLTVSRRKRTA